MTPVVRIANYFDVKKGSLWGPRRIPDHELIFIVRGSFEYEEGPRRWTVGKNSILCIPPNTLHRFRHVRHKGTISCIHFDLFPKEIDRCRTHGPEVSPQTLTSPANPEFYHHLFREIHASFTSAVQEERYLTEVLFQCLWAKLSRCWHNDQRQGASRRLKPILSYLRNNLNRRFSRSELAAKFGYTPEHINYLFKRELGITPTQFVNQEKILLAFDMLSNRKMTIREVSDQLGFCDQYHFSKVFKKVIGRPPSLCTEGAWRGRRDQNNPNSLK